MGEPMSPLPLGSLAPPAHGSAGPLLSAADAAGPVGSGPSSPCDIRPTLDALAANVGVGGGGAVASEAVGALISDGQGEDPGTVFAPLLPTVEAMEAEAAVGVRVGSLQCGGEDRGVAGLSWGMDKECLLSDINPKSVIADSLLPISESLLSLSPVPSPCREGGGWSWRRRRRWRRGGQNASCALAGNPIYVP